MKKVCHSEPVTDVTGVGIPYRIATFSKNQGIATPACGLVRNDNNF